jgi:hypothetical protein
LDAVGRVEGFRDCLREEPHGGGDGLGRKYRVNWAICGRGDTFARGLEVTPRLGVGGYGR